MANQTFSKSNFSNTRIDITITSIWAAQIRTFYATLLPLESFARNNILVLSFLSCNKRHFITSISYNWISYNSDNVALKFDSNILIREEYEKLLLVFFFIQKLLPISSDFWAWKYSVSSALTLLKKMKFSIKDFFSKCDQIRSILWICWHLLKKPLMENFIFCEVLVGVLTFRLFGMFEMSFNICHKNLIVIVRKCCHYSGLEKIQYCCSI